MQKVRIDLAGLRILSELTVYSILCSMDSAMTDTGSDPSTPEPSLFNGEAVRKSSTTKCRASDPYSLRDFQPRKRGFTVSGSPSNGSPRETLENPFVGWRDEFGVHSTASSTLPDSPARPGMSDYGIALRLKGAVDKLEGFSLGGDHGPSRLSANAEGFPIRRRQMLPVISQLKQESKSFVAAECYGEGEMHAKMRLSRSCSDLTLPNLFSSLSWTPPATIEASPSHSVAMPSPPSPSATESCPVNVFTERASEPISIAGSSRCSSVDLNDPEVSVSPVGLLFTMPASPHSPSHVGRNRSGSQSPYRRTYSTSNGMRDPHLRQSLLGKRKAQESDDESATEKRFCVPPSPTQSVLNADMDF